MSKNCEIVVLYHPKPSIEPPSDHYLSAEQPNEASWLDLPSLQKSEVLREPALAQQKTNIAAKIKDAQKMIVEPPNSLLPGWSDLQHALGLQDPICAEIDYFSGSTLFIALKPRGPKQTRTVTANLARIRNHLRDHLMTPFELSVSFEPL